jgi:hypothetical protein
VLVPPLQLVPLQHPVQHLPSLQLPFWQGVPAGAFLLTQLPEEQVSVVQTRLSSQSAQAAPPLPHWLAVEPVWHAEPSQHPVQQAPPKQSPPLQGVLSGLASPVHLPARQTPEPHSEALPLQS